MVQNQLIVSTYLNSNKSNVMSKETKIILVGVNVGLLVQLPFLLIRFQIDWSAGSVLFESCGE